MSEINAAGSSSSGYVDPKCIEKAKEFNKIFGSDISTLKKSEELVDELSKLEVELQKRLQAGTREVSSIFLASIEAAEKALARVEQLKDTVTQMESLHESHYDKMREVVDKIRPSFTDYRECCHIISYQNWVKAIEEQNKEIESALYDGTDGQAMLGYEKLSAYVKTVSTCHWQHLKSFTQETHAHWHNILLKKFSDEFEKTLQLVKWPFLNDKPSHDALPQEHLNQLELLFKYLLKLSEHEAYAVVKKDTATNSSSNSILPVQLLLKPLKIRFCYHFTGNKTTNSKETPEWYLAQLLKWVSNHVGFIHEHFQPLVSHSSFSHISAKVDFMAGLVQLAVSKLTHDLPSVKYDDDIFCHTIQEVLNFERELQLVYGYMSSQPSVLAVITQAQYFLRWIYVERKFATETMDDLVSSPAAWDPTYDGENVNCCYQLIILLQGITDRYKCLKQPGHRLQFVELQQDLLEDFRIRIVQVLRMEKQCPFTSNYMPILNAVHHIITTLEDWGDLTFFVEIQFYNEKFQNAQEENLGCQTSSFHNRNTSVLSPLDKNTSFSRKEDTHVSGQASPGRTDVDITGTVFDSVIKLYTHIKKDMIMTLCDYVLCEVKARSQSYRKYKWFSVQDETFLQDQNTDELSGSICPMLTVLVKYLASLREALVSPVFSALWRNIASELNLYLYEEVILQNKFSKSGAMQLKTDVTSGLFPIFGEFTQKPENYFKLIKESVILLTLPRPTALLLKDTIVMWQEQDSSCPVSPLRALSDQGISELSPSDASVILNLRTNMSTS